MKHLINKTFVLPLLAMVFLLGTANAQTYSSATDALLAYEGYVQQIGTISNQTLGQINALGNAANNGNGNLLGNLIPSILENMSRIEEFSDELNTAYYQAEALDPNARNLFLLTSGSRIEGLGDIVENNIAGFESNFQAGNFFAAADFARRAFNTLTVIHDIADRARDESRDTRNAL